jgi:hypothetical protein
MVSREELFELVWTEPMTAVAKRFNVSGSYLARVCSRLNVPRPVRGYWAKLAVGKAPARPTLAQPRAGDEINWDPDGRLPEVALAPSTPLAKRAMRSGSSRKANSLEPHGLIKGGKALFLTGRESWLSHYLKPSKRLLPEIHVTKTALDAALDFADSLFKQLELRGHRVALASSGEQINRPPIDTRDKPDKQNHHVDLWSPARATVAYVNGTAIGIAIFELTEVTQMRYVNGAYIKEKDYVPPKAKWTRDANWTSTQHVACGRFAVLAYASCYTEKWQRIWKEERAGDFLKGVKRLAHEIESCQPEAATTIQRGKEAAEAEQIRYEQMRRAWQKEEEDRRLKKALADSRLALDRMIDNHVHWRRLEEFLLHVESKRRSLDEPTRQKLDELALQARILYKNDSSLDDFLAWLPPNRLPD